MKESSETEKNKYANLLAEFLLSKIGKEKDSFFEVIDCSNFIVIKGKTNSDEILNLNLLKTEFINLYSNDSDGLKIGNTIDLIEYSENMEPSIEYSFDFFNTQDLKIPSCKQRIISTIYKSDFPNGYSLRMGKRLFFYAKHIAYNLQAKYHWNKLSITICEKDHENTFEIYTDDCEEQNHNVRSSILDSFDFNFSWIDKNYLNENFENDFLKKVNSDFVIF